jgi:N-acetylmuramoyl-L-alanine amidase
MNRIRTSRNRAIFLQFIALLATLLLSLGITGCSYGAAESGKTQETTSATDQPSSMQISSEQDSIQEKIVLIDPAHGGADAGATYTDGNNIKIKEKELNLKVSLLLQDMLKESGVHVELTRQEDKEISLEDRMELAENLNASLLVSVHYESNPDSTQKGTLTRYNSSNDEAVYGITGQKAAQLIHNKATKGLETEDAGMMAMSKSIKYDSLKMPAVIIELAFMSNESDRKRLITEEFSLKAAKALHDGIIAVLNEMEGITSNLLN